ncbi:MAG TPA: site-2 protease family protein [Gemmatimonadaceae bacterium]|nr:site-2 protease family protein [Gemmatimonadaceae bacterium]
MTTPRPTPAFGDDGSRPAPDREVAQPRASWKNGGLLAALGALLVKFKSLIFLLLGKAKLIFFGLAKLKTALSMLAYFGTYWAMYGWKYAGGIVVSIYVHEMGHVIAARRHGIRASAPVFIPFVGAFILLKEAVTDVRVNARIGLEGPVFGLGAALAFYVAYITTNIHVLGVIAASGAFINMFNLLPVLFLDGARGYSSLTRNDRWTLVGALAGIAFLLKDPWLGILALAGVAVSTFSAPSEESDKPMLFLYLFLAVSLALIVRTVMHAR